MSESFDLNDLEHFTVGAIGPPGQRVFYLQAGVTGTLVTLKVEKQEVDALARHFAAILDEITDDPESIEPEADIGLIDPVEAEWTAGEFRFGYDAGADRMLLIITERPTQEEADELATAQFRITRGQAAGFVDRAQRVVASGRPPCRYCGAPLNDDGTWCPCYN